MQDSQIPSQIGYTVNSRGNVRVIRYTGQCPPRVAATVPDAIAMEANRQQMQFRSNLRQRADELRAIATELEAALAY